MTFDAVLDENWKLLFNDTPAMVRKWLNDQPSTSHMIVVPGDTLKQKTVEEYLHGL
jgi:hypothetical protein